MQITLRPAPLAAALVSAFLTISFGAWPGPVPRHGTAGRVAPGTGALRFGRSVGSPTQGHLIGGTRLESTPYLRVTPVYTGTDARWGLGPLVDAIDRAARAVRQKYPDAVTSVGHLSRFGGGDIDRHHSHESGRDADIGFFVRNKAGRPVLPETFVSFLPDGSAGRVPGLFFDDARNWAFLEAILADPHAHITHVFVASSIRARLLAYAEKAGVPQAIRVRAAELMVQPKGVLPHDDHFHLRIACPGNMPACIENPSAPARAKRGGASGRERARDGHAPAAPHRSERATVTPRRVERPAVAKATPPRPAGGGPQDAERSVGPSFEPPGGVESERPDLPAMALPVDDVDGPM